MQARQERFQKYITTFQELKEALEEKINSKPVNYPFFSMQKQEKKLNKMQFFLNYLKSYEEKFRNLIEEPSQVNKSYYEESYTAVIDFLERIEQKNHSKLPPDDFELIVTTKYESTSQDKMKKIFKIPILAAFCMGSSFAVITGLLAGVLLFMAPLFGLGFYFFLFSPIIACLGLILGLIVGFIAGALVGGLLGLVIGAIVFYCSDISLNEALNMQLLEDALEEVIRPFVSRSDIFLEKDEAFNTQLLKDALEEYYLEGGVQPECKNDDDYSLEAGGHNLRQGLLQ